MFGGGHVVLPLLQTAAVGGGMVPDADFLAGYGVAQAVPGPLFTFAAFLGSASAGPLSGWAGGLAMLVAIFLPGALLVAAALPFWESLRRRPGVRNMVAGVNAAVVGILLSALYDPVWTSAIRGKWDFALALALIGLVVYARWSPVVAMPSTCSLLLRTWCRCPRNSRSPMRPRCSCKGSPPTSSRTMQRRLARAIPSLFTQRRAGSAHSWCSSQSCAGLER